MKQKKYLYPLLISLFLVGAAAAWALHNNYTKHSRTIIPNTTKQQTASNDQKTSTNSTTQTQTSDKSQSGSSTSQTSAQVQTTNLLAPSGNFVSNHKPGQNNSPTSETSVCNTTPGATCLIQFTLGSTVKKLDAKTTDSNGSIIWYWDVKDAGFGEGNWKVTAIATLNGQTKITEDNTLLQVAP